MGWEWPTKPSASVSNQPRVALDIPLTAKRRGGPLAGYLFCLARYARLAVRGESLASHRDGRGASVARRDDREYREYLREEQRRQRGCIARRMPVRLSSRAAW